MSRSLSQEPFGFIGAGPVARALADALTQAGSHVVAVCSQHGESAQHLAQSLPGAAAVASAQAVADSARVVFVAVPDDRIQSVASAVRWAGHHVLLHCSGALSYDVLASAQQAGARTGTVHPLQTFPRALPVVSLRGVACAVDSNDAEVAEALADLVRQWGGQPFHVPAGARPLYHASAVLACASVVTLVHEAARLWCLFGLTEQEALEHLLPLLQGTVNALAALGPAGALTGPVARGDADTLRQHRAALTQAAAETEPLYRLLAQRAIPLAQARGSLSREQADALRHVLQEKDLLST